MVFINTKIFFISLPLIAYLVAGSTKFIINYILMKNNAFSAIGLGGFPSTHTSIVAVSFFNLFFIDNAIYIIYSSTCSLLLIVIIDAMDLRNRIGTIAKAINYLYDNEGVKNISHNKIREKNGHKPHEIIGGLFIGFLISFLASNLI